MAPCYLPVTDADDSMKYVRQTVSAEFLYC